jgi:hypothetical protein
VENENHMTIMTYNCFHWYNSSACSSLLQPLPPNQRLKLERRVQIFDATFPAEQTTNLQDYVDKSPKAVQRPTFSTI